MQVAVNAVPVHLNPESGYWYRKLVCEVIPKDQLFLSSDILLFFATDLGLLDLAPQITWVRPEDWRISYEEVSQANLRRLETGEPYVCDCFHEPEDFSGYTPYAGSRDIWIRVDLPEPELITAIADEVRHLWQSKIYGNDYRRNYCDEAEVDAARYAFDAVERYHVHQRRRLK